MASRRQGGKLEAGDGIVQAGMAGRVRVEKDSQVMLKMFSGQSYRKPPKGAKLGSDTGRFAVLGTALDWKVTRLKTQ